jgi:hypothetical protein
MNNKKFQEIINEIENSQGYKIDNGTYELENSFIITVLNFNELKMWLENIPIFSVEQKKDGESRKFMINALRLISNYLTSVIALKDHVRNFIRKTYGSTEEVFDCKYQKKIDDEFKDNLLAQFIEDIRNFQQHCKSLPISLLSKVKDGKLYSRIVLSKKFLIESNYKWGKGKIFLNKIDDNEYIDVLEITEGYLYKTIFPWIMQQHAKEHELEFDKLQNLKDMAHKIYEN